jgi:ArsR family transcriptional regulator
LYLSESVALRTYLAQIAEAKSRNRRLGFMLVDNIRYIEYSILMSSTVREYKASIFQALAHPTRIAILEALREGELSAGAIQERLGVVQANVSQHLSILRSRQIVSTRKDGNQVFYSLRHKVLLKVLDLMRQYLQAHLHESVLMLDEMKTERQAAR